jgi:hypothetical protein
MRVYYNVGFDSWGLNRVVMELERYLPSDFQTTGDFDSADLTVLHVVGRRDHILRDVHRILQDGKKYAIIQYAFQSTRNPNPGDWLEIWDNAHVVWSYYDLSQYVKNFYHAPLASNSDVFYKQDAEKKYIVGTNGNCYKAECIGEAHLAAWEVNGRAIHMGEKFGDNPIVDYVTNISDDDMRLFYNQCVHFSSLRRKDGFEMPAIEALLCGVRPIMFDTPNYRQWFDGLADFIPECGIGETAGRLKRLFKAEPSPVTNEDIEEVKRRFNWERSVKGFWERCMI